MKRKIVLGARRPFPRENAPQQTPVRCDLVNPYISSEDAKMFTDLWHMERAFYPVRDAINEAVEVFGQFGDALAKSVKEIEPSLIRMGRLMGFIAPYKRPRRAHRRLHGGRWNKQQRRKA